MQTVLRLCSNQNSLELRNRISKNQIFKFRYYKHEQEYAHEIDFSLYQKEHNSLATWFENNFCSYFCLVRSSTSLIGKHHVWVIMKHEHNVFCWLLFAIWCEILNCSDDIFFQSFYCSDLFTFISIYFWNHDHRIIIIIYIHSFYGPKSMIILYLSMIHNSHTYLCIADRTLEHIWHWCSW